MLILSLPELAPKNSRHFGKPPTISLENNAFPVLHYVIKVTLHYLLLHHFEIHSALELSRTVLSLCCRLAASSAQGCSLAITR